MRFCAIGTCFCFEIKKPKLTVGWWQEIAATGAGVSVGEAVQWTLEPYLPGNETSLASWLTVKNIRCTESQHGWLTLRWSVVHSGNITVGADSSAQGASDKPQIEICTNTLDPKLPQPFEAQLIARYSANKTSQPIKVELFLSAAADANQSAAVGIQCVGTWLDQDRASLCTNQLNLSLEEPIVVQIQAVDKDGEHIVWFRAVQLAASHCHTTA